MGVAPVTEDKSADRARYIADAVRRERRDNGDLRIARRKEELRKDQCGGLGVDEEVVVLERRADPAARGRLLCLLSVLAFGAVPGR
jgi:hypothetical protein